MWRGSRQMKCEVLPCGSSTWRSRPSGSAVTRRVTKPLPSAGGRQRGRKAKRGPAGPTRAGVEEGEGGPVGRDGQVVEPMLRTLGLALEVGQRGDLPDREQQLGAPRA